MQKQPSTKKLEYRHYDLPVDFPVIALLRGEFDFPPLMFDGINFMHLHNCIELGICHTGEGMIRLENKFLEYGAGDVLLVPPFASHITFRDPELAKSHPSEMEYLYFDPEKLFESLPENRKQFLAYFRHDSPDFPYVLRGAEHPRLVGLITSVFEVLHRQETHYREEVTGLLLAVLAGISRILPPSVLAEASTPVGDTVIALTPCMSHINQNYMNHLAPQDMANLCHMSVTHFRRTFKATVGMTPVEYIQLIRIYKAKEFLYRTEQSMLEISLAVGFESVSSFNRNFMKIVGTTPKKWRNEIRAIQKKRMHYSQFQWRQAEESEVPSHD